MAPETQQPKTNLYAQEGCTYGYGVSFQPVLCPPSQSAITRQVRCRRRERKLFSLDGTAGRSDRIGSRLEAEIRKEIVWDAPGPNATSPTAEVHHPTYIVTFPSRQSLLELASGLELLILYSFYPLV